MKKIIPILLTVVMLFALTIPVFADDTVSDLSNTTWVIHSGWASAGDYSFNVSGTLISVDGEPNGFTFAQFQPQKNSDVIKFVDTSTTPVTTITVNKSSTFIVKFDTGMHISNATFVSFVNSAGTILLECDGTACSANDANLDGVCDDCGAPITMSLRSPTLDEMKSSAPYYHYFIYKTVDTTTGAFVDTRLSFLSSNSPMTLSNAEWDRTNDSAWGSVSFRFTGDSDIDGVNYVSHDGGITWQRETTYSNGTTLFYVDENFVSSTFDFRDRDTGEIFFPLPLWEITQGVTMETLETQTLGAVAGTITTLTLCGVGLMALLVVLSLFGKRSLIFRH